MRWIGFILFISLISSSCNQKNSIGLKVPILNFDSTAYYDSLFTEARYSIDTFFQKRLDTNLFNGNVLFAYKGRIICEKSFGFVDPEHSDSLKSFHKFQIASVTKTFTSTAILQLIEKGKIKWNDSVQYFIDSFPYKGITVEMLLCHRGGLSKYEYYSDDYWLDKSVALTNQDVVDIMKKYQPKPYHQPDGTFEYSNTGYVLLSLIIEKASGMKYAEYLKKNIFEPAGMKDTYVYNKKEQTEIPDMLEGYDYKGRIVPDSYQNGVTGDKGIYTTTHDLFLYDRALRSQTLLSKEIMAKAYTPTSKEREEKGKDNYGLGWRLKNSHNGYQIVYHTGWWKGFRTNFIRNMTKDITIITIDNIKRNPFLSIEQLMDLTESIKENEKVKRNKE